MNLPQLTDRALEFRSITAKRLLRVCQFQKRILIIYQLLSRKNYGSQARLKILSITTSD